MSVELSGTTAAEVSAALARLRRRTGSAALGMVFTLIVSTEERDAYDAVKAATEAAMEHPSRILAVIRRAAKSPDRLDAELRAGAEAGSGETVLLRLYGHLGEHADSVVLPLLLPDAPVVTWWPGTAPPVPADSPLGRLAQRRVSDAAAAARPLAALAERAAGYCPCDTDLAWTRLTPWRALLAAALDQPYDRIVGAEVAAARGNPSAPLLVGWLRGRLGLEVGLRASRGPGITAVRLVTEHGDVSLTRPDGLRATLSRPHEPDRTVALPRRRTTELLAEELRRLDEDEVYGDALRSAYDAGLLVSGRPPERPAGRASTRPSGRAAGGPRSRGRSSR